jgi:hypothetical protein
MKTKSPSDGAPVDDVEGRAGQNEGEGSQTGARQYNEGLRRFINSGKVSEAAEDAARAAEGPEGPELRRAERVGKQRSHGEDPKITNPHPSDRGRA